MYGGSDKGGDQGALGGRACDVSEHNPRRFPCLTVEFRFYGRYGHELSDTVLLCFAERVGVVEVERLPLIERHISRKAQPRPHTRVARVITGRDQSAVLELLPRREVL